MLKTTKRLVEALQVTTEALDRLAKPGGSLCPSEGATAFQAMQVARKALERHLYDLRAVEQALKEIAEFKIGTVDMRWTVLNFPLAIAYIAKATDRFNRHPLTLIHWFDTHVDDMDGGRKKLFAAMAKAYRYAAKDATECAAYLKRFLPE